MRYLERPAFDGFLRSLVDAGYELIGPTVRDGAIELGQWQEIFLCEFDGPRSRTVLVTMAASP